MKPDQRHVYCEKSCVLGFNDAKQQNESNTARLADGSSNWPLENGRLTEKARGGIFLKKGQRLAESWPERHAAPLRRQKNVGLPNGRGVDHVIRAETYS